MATVHKCETCGKDVIVSPARERICKHFFCDWCCWREWFRLSWPIVVCEICGKILQKSYHAWKRAEHHFCSPRCRAEWASFNVVGKDAPRWNGGKVKVICAQCGTELERIKYDVGNTERFFCNLKCRGKWMSENKSGENHHMWRGEHFTVKCDYCGKELMRPKWWFEQEREHFFCDKQCSANWKSENLTGENHPLWRGGVRNRNYGPNWKRQKRLARKRDNYHCRHCGIIQNKHSKKLHVHHLKPFRDFDYIPGENKNYIQANDLLNLITLCNSCHIRAEFGKIALQPVLL